MKISVFWAVLGGFILAVLIILLVRLIGKIVDIVRNRVWDFFIFKYGSMEELKISLDAALIAIAIFMVVVYVLKFLKKRFEEYL